MAVFRHHILELQIVAICIALLIVTAPGAPSEVARAALFGSEAIVGVSLVVLLSTALWGFWRGWWLGAIDAGLAVVIGYVCGALLSRPDIPGDHVATIDRLLGASIVGVLCAAFAVTAVLILSGRRIPSSTDADTKSLQDTQYASTLDGGETKQPTV